MDTELKPCPFCGEEAGICEANDICFHRDDDGNKIFGGWRCFCPSCAIEQIGYETREEAVSAWNNRSTEHATHRAPVDEKGGGRMTGIERLRELGREQDERSWSTVGKVRGRMMLDIADQIERELREKLCESQIYKLRAMAVYLEMNRHVLGHEGMEDSPVARWARELREALGGEECDHAEDVSVSAYDLLPEEDRDAISWVRKHGGLDAVKRRWECLSYYADPVPRSRMEKRLARLQRQIDESHAALRRRNERIKELNHRASDLTRENAELRKRAMPEGMCWPVFEDGEPVRPGDRLLDKGGDWFEAVSFVFTCDWWSVRGYQTEGFGDLNDETRRKLEGMAYGTCVKRPVPKVLDADGVEIRVGDRVWSTHLDEPNGWIVIDPHEDRDDSQTVLVSIGDRTGHARPENLTHRAPVLADDGRPLEVGQTVYHIADGKEYTVEELFEDGAMVTHDGITGGRCRAEYLTHERPVLGADGKPLREGETVYLQDGESFTVDFIRSDGNVAVRELSSGMYLRPERLTHERPDSWERLEEDAKAAVCVYFGVGDRDCGRCGLSSWECSYDKARDLVRRAKALAERDA